MLIAENTPNHAGITLYGDYMDFDHLYEALHIVIGEEDESSCYFPARTRILGLCYEIRHALMGQRDFEFVDNGLDDEKKKYLGILAPSRNVYLKMNLLWPETLFILMALNDFVLEHAKSKMKAKHEVSWHKEPKIMWDPSIAHVKIFQSAVSNCLKETLSETAFVRLLNTMNSHLVHTSDYMTLYIDFLNEKFVNFSSDNRLKNISAFGKRIAERESGNEYSQFAEEVRSEAEHLGCDISELTLADDFPEEFEW